MDRQTGQVVTRANNANRKSFETQLTSAQTNRDKLATKIDALNIILNRSEKGGFSEHLAEVQQIISSALLLTSTEDSDGSNENKTSLVAYRGYEPQTVTKSENIKNKYEPALNKTFPTLSKGIKLLMQAQVQLEGFTPGTVAYRSNNPGNVGTETSIKPPRIKKYDTLEEGIQAQWNRVLKGALNNTSSTYDVEYAEGHLYTVTREQSVLLSWHWATRSFSSFLRILS